MSSCVSSIVLAKSAKDLDNLYAAISNSGINIKNAEIKIISFIIDYIMLENF